MQVFLQLVCSRRTMNVWWHNKSKHYNKLNQKKKHKMLNLNKRTKLNLNQRSSLRTAHMCVCIIVHSFRTQHSTVLIIFPLVLQTFVITHSYVYWREGVLKACTCLKVWVANLSNSSQVSRERKKSKCFNWMRPSFRTRVKERSSGDEVA